MILMSLLLRFLAFGFKIIIAVAGMMAIILFRLESNFFNYSTPIAFIENVMMWVLALPWFLTILSISYCPRCKFIIAWQRLNRNWVFNYKGESHCPKCLKIGRNNRLF